MSWCCNVAGRRPCTGNVYSPIRTCIIPQLRPGRGFFLSSFFRVQVHVMSIMGNQQTRTCTGRSNHLHRNEFNEAHGATGRFPPRSRPADNFVISMMHSRSPSIWCSVSGLSLCSDTTPPCLPPLPHWLAVHTGAEGAGLGRGGGVPRCAEP